MLQFPKLHTKSVHCPMNKKRKKQWLKFRFKAQKRPVCIVRVVINVWKRINFNYKN